MKYLHITTYLLSITLLLLSMGGCTTNKKSIDQNRNYYIDAIEGDDANSGQHRDEAWQSLQRLNEVTLLPGDSVLLKRGSVFREVFEFSAAGNEDNAIVIADYGQGEKPRIAAPDDQYYAMRIFNSSHITVKNLDITNKGSEVLAGRTGLKIEIQDYGTSRNMQILEVDVHDVNGSLVKAEGGGSGILLVNGGDSIVSVFEDLLIEGCTVRRCQRNAMIWSGYWSRSNWHPNKNIVVRGNLIEGVPGDGIVPIGCDSTLIEYNVMRNCPALLPATEAAAGIWPWSSDNTTIQFNEVSDHKAPWDAQGFDSDWNCRNTLIQYNFSHHNEGGFILVCNDGSAAASDNAGNSGTVVRYNVSFGDAERTATTRAGYFSPSIHLAGPTDHTTFTHNIIHVKTKPGKLVDRSIITLDSWNGLPNETSFIGNIFYAEEQSNINYTQSTGNTFENNFFLGELSSLPEAKNNSNHLPSYADLLNESDRFDGLEFFLETSGPFGGSFVKRETIEHFFSLTAR